MFKLNMTAIRKSANDTWLMANTANAANESGTNGVQISQHPRKLAELAKLAISQQLNCTLQADPANDLPSVEPTTPTIPAKPPKQTFMDWQDTWLNLDRAYQAHHFKCSTCIAAGRGAVYGLRCGVGAALWRAYSDGDADRRGLDW